MDDIIIIITNEMKRKKDRFIEKLCYIYLF